MISPSPPAGRSRPASSISLTSYRKTWPSVLADNSRSPMQPCVTIGTSEAPKTRVATPLRNQSLARRIRSGGISAPPQANTFSDGSRVPAARAAFSVSARNGVAPIM